MRSLPAFLLLTHAVSWSLFLAAAALPAGAAGDASGSGLLRAVLIFLGAIAPGFVALSLTARAEGRPAARALFRRAFQGPVRARWLVFAVGYMAAIKLSAALLLRLSTGAWPALGATPVVLMLGAMLVSTPVQAGEEIGWRGFALPRLAARLGLPGASLALGPIWAFWHLPLFLIPGTDTSGQSFPVYLLQVTAISVAMAWLYWQAGGSLFPVMLLHAAINNTKDIVPSAVPGAREPFALGASPVAWLTAALLWACAAFFLAAMRRASLERIGGPREPAPTRDAKAP